MEKTTVNSKVTYGKLDNDKNIQDWLIEHSSKLGEISCLIVYKHHEIQIGKIENSILMLDNKEELNVELLKGLRLFSKKGELYLYKKGDGFNWRLRIDGNGDTTDIYEETHIIWGTKVNGNYLEEENRGMKLKLPFNLNPTDLPLKYRVRNYFKYNFHGFIEFYDARLVCFLKGKEEEIYV